MNDQELIQDLLAIPSESQNLEFKRLCEERVVKKTVQTIVALANTEGGIIVLGIDDPEKTKLKGNNRIFGIDENPDVFDEIGREIQRIIPPLGGIWPPKIVEAENTKRVGLLFVPKATEDFFQINGEVYVRLERGNRRLQPHQILNFSYAKGFQKADKLLVDVDFDLLNTTVFKEWKSARTIDGDTIENILEKTGLAKKEAGILRPTLAAVMLFADYPTDLTETKCAIRVFQYTGTVETMGEKPNLLGLPKTIQGPLIKQIQDAHEYVLTLLRAGIKVPSGFKNIYKIPERAIKEAITNAVIHRDYYIKRDIAVRIFEDRVEIESPGLFPYNITQNNIGYVRAVGYRNDLLVKHLREFPSPPNLDENEGVRAMRFEMNAENLYPPIFLTYPLYPESVKVVLLNEHRPSEWEKIHTYLQNNKFVTNEQCRKIIGMRDRNRMSYLLNRWSEQGLLIKIVPSSGYLKGTKYKLPEYSALNEER